MDLNSLLAQLQQINPYWAAGVAFFFALVRGGIIKLPWQVPLLSPPQVAAEPEHQPLKDRLETAVGTKFESLIDAGEDADDAYNALVLATRNCDPKVKKAEGK